jgi:peptidoglycan hydrolase-like protein with peptidoglycan-binding domain
MLLRQGMSGDTVLQVQRRLQALGHYQGALDGDFGPLTRWAVAAFQQAWGLVADGVVGPATWGTLFPSEAPEMRPPASPKPGSGSYPENFLRAVALTLRAEGGFSNRPLHEDPGGATNLGVTQGLLDTIGGWNGKRNVRQLSEADAVGIYHRHFWERFNCGALPWPLSCAVFDHCVNAGAHGVRVLQKLLCDLGETVAVDGGLGPSTERAVDRALHRLSQRLSQKINLKGPDALAEEWLTFAYLFRRLRDYATRPGLSVRQANMSGWANRLCDLEEAFRKEG